MHAGTRSACAYVFESLEEAEKTLTAWRSDYNTVGLCSALGMLTAGEFAELGQMNAGRRWPEFPAVRVASNRGEDPVFSGTRADPVMK